MVPVPLLPSCGCDADILFLGLARGRHLGLVDRALVQAPAPLHDAAGLLFSPAVAVLLLEVDGDGGGYLGVVAGRDLGKTRKCPVAQLYRVPVQSLVKQVAGWEAPVEQLEEVVADLGLDTLAERWIEPENPAAARPLARSAPLAFNVFQILFLKIRREFFFGIPCMYKWIARNHEGSSNNVIND